jgi:hypothetical protein
MPRPWAIAIIVAFAGMMVRAQQVLDPEAVLKRTRERLLDDLSRLPRYTCVQTITRRYFDAPAARPHSCAGLIAARDRRAGELRAHAWDRLRLEVAIVEGNSVFSWVGASGFEVNNLEAFAGHGPLGSGDFGSFLDSAFRYAVIQFEREATVANRRLYLYSYQIPRGRSGYLVRAESGWVPTAYTGTFLLDPEAADIVQLTVRTAELPETNPACQANTEVQYQRTSIHERMILIPRETRLNAIERDGTESVSVTGYESCREYASRSRVLASAPSEPVAAKSTPGSGAVSPLSPGLHFEARIVTPIDSNTAAAGDSVEAVLRSAIHDKKNNVLIPVGARLHGRLMRMEHTSGTFDSIRMAVQWESIAAGGQEVPLRAKPEGSNRIGQVFVLSNEQSPDVRTIVFHSDHLNLRQFDWNWVTVAPDVGRKSDSVAAGTTALPHMVQITDGQLSISAESGVDLEFSVPANASDVHLEVTFNAAAGSLGGVAVLLFTSDEFLRWRNEEPATTLYSTGDHAKGTLDVILPPGAGTYYLVFSNLVPLSTPKVIDASVRLHYKP